MPASMVTRPKSKATVVVVFRSRWPRSSIPTEAVVVAPSVVSGSISDRAPMAVVLPTPKPPETMILTGIGVRPAPFGASPFMVLLGRSCDAAP